MNKNIVLIILLLAVAWYVLKRKSISRADMIDFLNVQVGYEDGIWTKLTDTELRTVYKPLALIKQNVKPDPADYLQAVEIGKKYNIKMFVA